MESKKYQVQIYYSGFCTYEVTAANCEDAITIARNSEINKSELLSNLQNWQDADSCIENPNHIQQ